jgi:hypothetical protein
VAVPILRRKVFPALRLLSDDERTQDDRMRAAAEKWIGAATALCGLFSVAGLVAAKDVLAPYAATHSTSRCTSATRRTAL